MTPTSHWSTVYAPLQSVLQTPPTKDQSRGLALLVSCPSARAEAALQWQRDLFLWRCLLAVCLGLYDVDVPPCLLIGARGEAGIRPHPQEQLHGLCFSLARSLHQCGVPKLILHVHVCAGPQ